MTKAQIKEELTHLAEELGRIHKRQQELFKKLEKMK